MSSAVKTHNMLLIIMLVIMALRKMRFSLKKDTVKNLLVTPQRTKKASYSRNKY